jgi:hypothetical protein
MESKMLATHKDAEERYTILRKAVLGEINKEFSLTNQTGMSARLIDTMALSQSRLWSQSPNRQVDWDWREGYTAFKFRYPKRFEMALWHNDMLVSLSLGRPTYNGFRLRLDFIEGNPDKPKDIKVFEPTVLAMVAYAQVLGATELRVMHPINQDVKKYYQRFGFSYVSKADYLYIRL